jgi:hypothetical protein
MRKRLHPKYFNHTCPLDWHGLRTYLFNDYYLRYFLSRLCRSDKPGLN